LQNLTWTFSITNPKNITPDSALVMPNRGSSTFTIDSVWGFARGNVDDFDFSLVEVATTGGTPTLIEAITLSTNGINGFYGSATSIDHAAIEPGKGIAYVKSADSTNVVTVQIYYHK